MKSDLVKKGVERAPHRSLFKAMGYTDEEIKRPLIGIANSVNAIIPGHIHLDKIVEAVKAGVYMAGGTPIEFGVIGVCDGIAMNHIGMKYSLASRELIADSIEVMATAHAFDAMVMVPNCDKIIPGMLMAAARLDLPAIVISGGPMLAGKHPEKIGGADEIDLITVFESVGAVLSGDMTEDQLCQIEDAACPTCGSCAGMFTANSMNCLTEAVGMGLARKWHDSCGDVRPYPPGQTSGHANPQAFGKKYNTVKNYDRTGLSECPGGGYGPWVLHQYRASPPCPGKGSQRQNRSRSDQRDQQSHASPLLSESRRTAPPGRPEPGRRHSGAHERTVRHRTD